MRLIRATRSPQGQRPQRRSLPPAGPPGLLRARRGGANSVAGAAPPPSAERSVMLAYVRSPDGRRARGRYRFLRGERRLASARRSITRRVQAQPVRPGPGRARSGGNQGVSDARRAIPRHRVARQASGHRQAAKRPPAAHRPMHPGAASRLAAALDGAGRWARPETPTASLAARRPARHHARPPHGAHPVSGVGGGLTTPARPRGIRARGAAGCAQRPRRRATPSAPPYPQTHQPLSHAGRGGRRTADTPPAAAGVSAMLPPTAGDR